MKKIRINILSKADSVPAQGVGSAYLEQTKLIQSIPSLDVSINSKKNDFDIVHIHSVNPSLRMRMKNSKINVMYVHFLPDQNDGSLHLPKFANKVFSSYVNSMYKDADELVVVNPCFIKPLVELGIDEKRITYIPNYVDKSNFFKLEDSSLIDKLKEKYGVPKDKFIVLGVGQVQTRKGVDDFVEVAKLNPDKFFIWAGGFSFGPITDGYARLKKTMENPPRNVKFLGIIEREKMNEIYNISSCLFMPSFIELFPMAILEAANVNIPIVLRDVELYKPILSDLYLKGCNVQEFSLVINDLSSNRSLYKIYSEKSKKISIMYSKEYISSLWEQYYSRIYNKYNDVK